MKKTLLALAAIAASSAAFAQSSVTLYGVLDASVESVKTAHTVTRVASDNLSSSRIGFKGTEDIGGGLKANFNLESAVGVDTGAATGTTNGSTRFFDRAAWVGLSAGFGEVRLGRQDTPIGDIARNVLVAQNYDDLKSAKTRAGSTYTRADNAITYILPTVVPGLTASLQYSTAVGSTAKDGAAGAEQIGDLAYGANSKAYGLGVKYVAGPVFAGIGYQYTADELGGTPATAGKQKSNATLGYAGYDFGLAKVTAYFDGETNLSSAVTGSRRVQIYGAKVAVPVAPQFTVIASGSVARNLVATDSNSDVQYVTIRAVYDLSKRTAVYGMFTNVNNDTGSKVSFNSDDALTAGGKTSRALAVGIKHAF